MVWNAEDRRVPPGEKRGSGEGSLVLSPALWGPQMCPLAAGQGRPQERGFNKRRAVPLTGGGPGVGQQCHRSKGPSQERGLPSNTQQDPNVLGREAVGGGGAAEPAGPWAPVQAL